MSINDESVTTLEDLRGDLAHRHKWTPSGGHTVEPAIVEADMEALSRDGYVIWENLLTAEDCRQIRDVVRPWLGHTGRNSFEGRRTQRVYSVLSRTRVCDRLADHPRVLAALDRLLIADAMAQLSAEHRAVIERSYYRGWTTTQTAADLGIAEGTVKSRLHYAVRALRLTLQELGVTR